MPSYDTYGEYWLKGLIFAWKAKSQYVWAQLLNFINIVVRMESSIAPVLIHSKLLASTTFWQSELQCCKYRLKYVVVNTTTIRLMDLYHMSLTCCIKSHCTPATLAPAHTPCLFSIDLHTVRQHLVIVHFFCFFFCLELYSKWCQVCPITVII